MLNLPLSTALAFMLSATAVSVARGAEDAGLGDPLPPIPHEARLALSEDWSHGIAADRWYMPRAKWGAGNNGVTRDNVRIETDVVSGEKKAVLVCQANGDLYAGPVNGLGGKKTRVGGIIVSKEFFASGRFEIVAKIGATQPTPGGPRDPTRPQGMIPAVWLYAYRFVKVEPSQKDDFVASSPLYNPYMKAFGGGMNEYWSELDFPEFGKGGDFDKGLYNTFIQNKVDTHAFDVSAAADGKYHTLTTEWRTRLQPIDGVTDKQVIEHEGVWWVQDRRIPFEQYLGNPLKRLENDHYAVYTGDRADHWIDGKKVADNTRDVPALAAQLTIGVWLPHWAGPAPWQTATFSIASVKVWQYQDPGDVRGVLTSNLQDRFDAEGKPIEKR